MQVEWVRLEADEPEEARVRVHGASAWFGPTLRAVMLHGVPVLAFDEYEEHWRQDALPSEVLWQRLYLLPLRTAWPPTPAASGVLNVWNVLHDLEITLTHATVTMRMCAVSPRDILRDKGATPLAVVGQQLCVRLRRVCPPPGMTASRTTDLCLESEHGGPWAVVSVGAEGVVLQTSRAQCEQALREWQYNLDDLQRLCWWPMAPAVSGAPPRWHAVRPRSARWRATWEASRGGVVFRHEAAGDSAAEDAATVAAVRRLGIVRLERAEGDAVLLQPAGDDGEPMDEERAVVRFDDTDGTAKLLLCPDNDDALLDDWRTRNWNVLVDGSGVRIQPAVAACEDMMVRASLLAVEPAWVRPADKACWDSVTLCCLRRGHTVRVNLSAKLGVGAEHARWAAALSGSPVKRPPLLRDESQLGELLRRLSAPAGTTLAQANAMLAALPRAWMVGHGLPLECDEGVWDVTAESAGQLSAYELLVGAGEVMQKEFLEAASAFQYAVDGPAPEAVYPAREAARNSTRRF